MPDNTNEVRVTRETLKLARNCIADVYHIETDDAKDPSAATKAWREIRDALAHQHQEGTGVGEGTLGLIAKALLNPGRYAERRMVPDDGHEDTLLPEAIECWYLNAIRIALRLPWEGEAPEPQQEVGATHLCDVCGERATQILTVPDKEETYTREQLLSEPVLQVATREAVAFPVAGSEDFVAVTRVAFEAALDAIDKQKGNEHG